MPIAGIMQDIYDQVNSVLGGTSPNQFLHLVVPGTSLNQADFAYDTTRAKPLTVALAESRLADQMFDIAKVAGSSNGQRVSSQYLQALSVLVPNFDPLMPKVKSELRRYLATPAPPNAKVDGVPFSGTIEDYYFALYEHWLEKKSAWETTVIEKQFKEYASSKEMFLEWYEGVAETELAKIDAARGRLLAVFSPSDMDAILGTLDSGPNGEIEEAVNTVLDIRTPSPEGGFVYPVEFSPSNWFLDLASDLAPEDLLADPAFIAQTLASRQAGLSATVAQLQSLVAQMPSSADLTAATSAYVSAQQQFSNAQQALNDQYTANTVTAANMVAKALTPGSIAADAVGQLDNAVGEISASQTNDPTPARAAKKDGSPIGPDDVAKIADGMTALSRAQTALTNSADGLAAAGVSLASAKAGSLGDAPAVLARLQQQLRDVQALRDQLAAAQTGAPRTSVGTTAALLPIYAGLADTLSASTDTTPADFVKTAWDAVYKPGGTDETPGDVVAVLAASYSTWTSAVHDAGAGAINDLTSAIAVVREAVATPTTTGDADVQDRTKAAFGRLDATLRADDGPLTALGKAVNPTTNPTDPEYVSAVLAAETTLVRDLDGWTKKFDTSAVAARSLTIAATPPTQDQVTKDIGTSALTGDANAAAYVTKATTDAAGSTDTLAAVKSSAVGRARSIMAGATSQKSGAADRWMDFRFSTSFSESKSISGTSSSSSQSSWHVDFWLGSAGGDNATSSAAESLNKSDISKTIEIGLKAAKVDIQRGWFDPGIFRLTNSLSRISHTSISDGPVTIPDDGTVTGNDCILPTFPVAFVVVKDVTIKFELDESEMQSVKSVLDSRSAAGGGFLCFSASSSSAARSDSSSLASKTSGTVVNIAMPGPQILGWFLEFTPKDDSQELKPVPAGTTTTTQTGTQPGIDVMAFIQALSANQTAPAGTVSAGGTQSGITSGTQA